MFSPYWLAAISASAESVMLEERAVVSSSIVVVSSISVSVSTSPVTSSRFSDTAPLQSSRFFN